jgi:hypothetical protein
MPIFIIIAIVAIVAEWYKNSLMCRKAEGFRFDDFWITLIGTCTIANVCATFFIAEVFGIKEVFHLFLFIAVFYVIDIMLYIGYQRSARRRGLNDDRFDITNDIRLS